MAFLALMLGGEYDNSQEKIEVTGDIPAKSFTAEGTFKVKTTAGFETKKIKFYNLSVQPTADLTLSASDVSSFSLVLDVMVDNTGKMLDIEKTM